MIKNSLLFGAAILISVSFTSCKSAIEKDAQKIADLKCQSKEILKKLATGDLTVMAESKKLGEEISKLSDEMEGKYASDTDKDAFIAALKKASESCE